MSKEPDDAITDVNTDAGRSDVGSEADVGHENHHEQAQTASRTHGGASHASGSEHGHHGSHSHHDHDHHEDDHSHKKKKKKNKHKHKHKEEHKKVVLFICDPQNDYSDEGSIPIPNSNMDSNRIYDMIKDHMDDILEIYVSLDSRHRTHISNPISWVNRKGEMPEPFTIITSSEVSKGKWKARQRVSQQDFADYVSKVEENCRLPFTIWPDHCLIGTWGQAIVPQINEALQEWAAHRVTTVEYIIKGTNTHTEMYSAICSEVPNPDDPSTELDLGMIERLKSADRVIICGQSLSHTVQMTMKDIVSNWKEDELDKLMLLTDCSSPIPGFEAMAESFVREMKDKGVTCTSASEALVFEAETYDGDDFADAAAVAEMTHKLALKSHKKHHHHHHHSEGEKEDEKESDNEATEEAHGDKHKHKEDKPHSEKHGHKHSHKHSNHSEGGTKSSEAAAPAGGSEEWKGQERTNDAGTEGGNAVTAAAAALMAPKDASSAE